jgi:hypothetical protein
MQTTVAQDPMETLTRQIVYAKNAAHQQFLNSFEGKLKGRSNLAFLVVIEFIGGAGLRKDIESALANPVYQPEEWYSARDAIVMFDRAIRAGVPAERLGHSVMPSYKRTFPERFHGKTTMRDAFELLEQAYRAHTTYSNISPGPLVESTRALIYRQGSPLPCNYFVGVIEGLFRLFSVKATTREIACEWNGAPACCYEANWSS